MNRKSSPVPLCAMLAALCVVFLYISSFFPTISLSACALASLTVAVVVIEHGKKWAFLVFAVSAALAMIILGVRETSLLYACFFGWYPLIKSFAEERHSRVAEWAIKLAALELPLSLYFVFVPLEAITGFSSMQILAFWLIIVTIVFVLMDYAMSRLISYYINSLRGRLGRK